MATLISNFQPTSEQTLGVTGSSSSVKNTERARAGYIKNRDTCMHLFFIALRSRRTCILRTCSRSRRTCVSHGDRYLRSYRLLHDVTHQSAPAIIIICCKQTSYHEETYHGEPMQGWK